MSLFGETILTKSIYVKAYLHPHRQWCDSKVKASERKTTNHTIKKATDDWLAQAIDDNSKKYAICRYIYKHIYKHQLLPLFYFCSVSFLSLRSFKMPFESLTLSLSQHSKVQNHVLPALQCFVFPLICYSPLVSIAFMYCNFLRFCFCFRDSENSAALFLYIHLHSTHIAFFFWCSYSYRTVFVLAIQYSSARKCRICVHL